MFLCAHAANGNKGKVGEAAYLEDWITTLTSIAAGESVFKVTFKWDMSFGMPGVVIVKNFHHSEFFLKTLTLEDFPGKGHHTHFICNSWVYPAGNYKYDRIFFVNKVIQRYGINSKSFTASFNNQIYFYMHNIS